MNRAFIMTRVLFGDAVGTASMTFMMCFVRLKIVDDPCGYCRKTGAMIRGDWAMEVTVHLVIGAVIVPIIYAMGFLKILLGPAVVKGGLALKK
jgi:hypothetical protein